MNGLYQKYRPKHLDRVVGNEETVNSIQNMVSRKTFPHAVLFYGPSGTGKTTLARIAKDLLKCHDLDFREVNSANNRGIDTIREIQSTMQLHPMAGDCRVWMIDECAKMSNDAQNAALKMLEDTPSHVYFMLCTTDPEKLIKAILTRCTPMPLRLLSEGEMGGLLDWVCKKENIKITPNVRDDLVGAAAGSPRALLVTLEKVAALEPAQREAAIAQKLAEENEAIELCRALIKKSSWKMVADILKNLKGEAEQTRWAVLGYARSVMLKGDNKEAAHQAYLVVCAFERNFFDSKNAGLARACFESIYST